MKFYCVCAFFVVVVLKWHMAHVEANLPSECVSSSLETLGEIAGCEAGTACSIGLPAWSTGCNPSVLVQGLEQSVRLLGMGEAFAAPGRDTLKCFIPCLLITQ